MEIANDTQATFRQRRRLHVQGVVQGVGFRPYIYRLAAALGLTGFVENSGHGVTIEIEGHVDALEAFAGRLADTPPPLTRIDHTSQETLTPCGSPVFIIRDSVDASSPTALLPPDIATCSDCVREINDPADRRYGYPFTNCTNCGPRYSIVESLPYDRQRTTMRAFRLCGACAAEYRNPNDRRFHAQPIACPDCGPQIRLLNGAGTLLAASADAIRATAEAIRRGKIVALKGLGGYQVLVDARNARAIKALRRRKRRPDKPFAVMFPDAETAAAHLHVTDSDRELLHSCAAPIVLIRHRDRPLEAAPIALSDAAPQNPLIGAMLPYTPLHHLLMQDLNFPIVATSGNIADEPMITDDDDAFDLLGGIADVFLTHNRPIAAPVDDSVVRVVAGRPLMLRCARGYAPMAIPFKHDGPRLVALGGHLKSVVAITTRDHIIVGPHVGDLDSVRARAAFEQSLDHLTHLHADRCEGVVCDRHPDYFTTRKARSLGPAVVPVQHHLAHIAACMADNGIDGPALGIVWDGTGYGDDDTIWGGEFIVVAGSSSRRAAHFRSFRLPGGDAAITEPRRAALGVLYALFKDAVWDAAPAHLAEAFSPTEKTLLVRMLSQEINAPLTSSAGRLFDAVASLAGLVPNASFEGQAAMSLENAISDESTAFAYRFGRIVPENEKAPPAILDWEPVIRAILADIAKQRPVAEIAIAFHNALVEAIVDMATIAGERRVVLTGGCFQNRYLTESSVSRLRAAGFEPVWHRRLPPNDGNLAIGQAVSAARLVKDSKPCA